MKCSQIPAQETSAAEEPQSPKTSPLSLFSALLGSSTHKYFAKHAEHYPRLGKKKWGWHFIGWERLVKLWQLQSFVCQQSLKAEFFLGHFPLCYGRVHRVQLVLLGKLPVLGWE